ncbi:MAG TPA: hypothetical protein V6C76_03440 [Drouetiella sp.]
MLGSPVDIAIIGVIVIVLFGGRRPPWTMLPPQEKPETWEKNPHSSKDPFPKPDNDLFIK